MTTAPSNQPAVVSSPSGDDEIDLRQVAGALGRHRRLIAKVAGASLLLSGIYAFTQKPVWEGQFQIVLEDQSSGGGQLAQLAAANPMLANLAGFGGSGTSSLETEVKILESPSVLKPVYDYVLSQKRKAGINVDRFTFADWLPSLKVELEKGTSVLNIAYQDTDKDLVLPVIKRVSQTYQTYSGRDRSRGLTQGVSYLEEQLTKLRPQANQSMRAAQAFALNNGLGLQDGMPAAVSAGSGRRHSGSVESSREAAQNKVNALQQQLSAARAAGSARVYVAPPAGSQRRSLRQAPGNGSSASREVSAALGQRSIHPDPEAPDPLAHPSDQSADHRPAGRPTANGKRSAHLPHSATARGAQAPGTGAHCPAG